MRVIGVLVGKGQTTFGTDQDDLVMIPFTTAERKVLGVAAPSQAQTPANWVYVAARESVRIPAAADRVCESVYVQAVTPTIRCRPPSAR